MNTALLWNSIKQISVKTIIACYERIKHNYISSQPEQYHNRMAFHILGLDIMIDDNFRPILLEVNHTPSFNTDTPLDSKLKTALIKDTLVLLRCNDVKLKEQLYNKAKIYSSKRIEHGIRQSLKGQDRKKKLI